MVRERRAVLSRVIALWSESDGLVPKPSLEIGRRLRKTLDLLVECLVYRKRSVLEARYEEQENGSVIQMWKTTLSRLVEGSGSGPKACCLMSSSRQLQLFPVSD